MEIETLFGLPAHPLVVHAAVVLLPLAAIGTIVVAVVPRARRVFGPLVFGVALVATIAVGMAQQSGEALEDEVDRTELVRDHTRQGENVLPWAIGLTVVAGVVAAAPLAAKKLSPAANRYASIGLIVFALVGAVGATWTVIEVGHSGAKATWDDVGDEDDVDDDDVDDDDD